MLTQAVMPTIGQGALTSSHGFRSCFGIGFADAARRPHTDMGLMLAQPFAKYAVDVE